MPLPSIGSRGRAALVLLSVAVVGLLAGVALDRSFLRANSSPPPSDRWDHPTPDAGPAGRTHFVERFAEELGLTDQQRFRVDSVLSGQQTRMQEVQAVCRPRVREILAETHAGIDEVLTPRQRERMEALRRERGWGREQRRKGPR
jgi:Spy/CpxP family protein refolding chaperone